MAKRERVYGTLDYSDGIIAGLADYRGQPHAFELDEEMNVECPVYRLMPVAPELVEALLTQPVAVPASAPLRARGRFEPKPGANGPKPELEVEWSAC